MKSKISAGMAYEFEGDDRSELNLFMQHGLVAIGYDRNSANRICKFVIAHCNDEILTYQMEKKHKYKYNVFWKMTKGIIRKMVAKETAVAK